MARSAAAVAVPAEPSADAVALVAASLVGTGRVVPGLTVEAEGRARSWWWPAPAASQRADVAALIGAGPIETRRQHAARLADAVDRQVRERLTADHVALVPKRPGRPTPATAWLRALTSPDPYLPASLPAARVRGFADAVATWVRSGGAGIGAKARLCLRVHEPDEDGTTDEWRVELLVQDRDETSLVVPLPEVLEGRSPFAAEVLPEVVGSLARLARVAPELAGVLEEVRPEAVPVDGATVVGLLRGRVGALDDAGIGLLLPSWWTHRPRLGLRAKVRRAGTKAGTAGGVGLGNVLEFDWEAALGDQRLTTRDLEALIEAAETKRSLVRVRGQWVEVDPTRMGDLLERIGRRERATAAELLRAGLGLDDLGLDGLQPDELDVLGVDASSVSWLSDLLDDALHATVEPLPTPVGFRGQLRPYQERGAGWLRFLGRLGLGGCLADDMGLGKTAQLIATLVADRLTAPTLVVCPVSVLGNWANELARFAPELRVLVHHGPGRHDDPTPFAERTQDHEVVLTTYSLLTRDVDHLTQVRWGRAVFDEAQQIKNPGTGQARAAQRIAADRRVALTGTPVENRLSELWSIMHVLNPGLLGSARSFRDRFALPIERDHDEETTELLRRVTAPFVLRRLKTDRSIISDLPDKIETVDRCPLTREQATLYRAVVDELLESADEAEGIDRRGKVLAGLLRLKQVCGHPAHFLGDGSALQGRSGKLQRVEELLEEILAEGDKVLCFTQFAAWGDLLAPYLAQRFGQEPLWLHGGVRRTSRDEMVARFQDPDGPRLFLVSLKAGGTGLNLTAASHVIHLDRWWNPAVEDQATDRAYRIGQQRTVQVHKLVCSGTLEERIDEMITAKRNLAERVVGSGEQWLTELDTDELRDVVALRAAAEEA